MKIKTTAASLIVVIALTATLPPTGVAGQEDLTNTEHLLKWCKQPEASANHAYCVGFIQGVGNMMTMVGASAQGDLRVRWGMCYPDPAPTTNAEIQAFINWAEKWPKYWGELNLTTVVVALSQTWPCTAEGKPAN